MEQHLHPPLTRTQLLAHSGSTNYRHGSARGVPQEGTSNLGLSATYNDHQSLLFNARPQSCHSQTTPCWPPKAGAPGSSGQ